MTTSNILSKSITAAAVLILCGASVHAANFVNTGTGADGAGELFVGFHATGGQGNGKSVVIDLGAISPLAALSIGSIQFLGSVGIDLAAQFGSNWYERTDLLWSAVAAVQSTVPTTSTDPASTLYGSVSGTGSFPLSTLGYTRGTNSAQNGVAQRVISNMAGNAGGFSSAGNNGATQFIAVESASDANSYASWMPGGTNLVLFGGFGAPIGQEFEQSFAPGQLSLGVEGALDVYQMYRSGIAQPDAANATTGAGAYQFTLTINQSGNITATVLPVPEPASVGLLMAGGMFLIGRRRRRACALRRKRGAKA
jgi:hypothetical protein